MAINKSIINIIIFILTFTKLSQCLYEDQIGKFDWKKSYIGKLKYASFDSVKRIIVATEENVLASLNLKNGQIAWRQVLENPDTNRIELLHVDNDVVTVSGNGNIYYIRGWDLNSGMLLYEWSMTTEKQNAKWLIANSKLYHIVPVINSHLEVTEYQLNTGLNKGSTSQVSTPWINNNCVLASTYYACISTTPDGLKLVYLSLSNDLARTHSYSIKELLGDVSGDIAINAIEHSVPSLLVRINNINRIITLEDGGQVMPKVMPYSLEANVISVCNGERNLLMELQLVRDIPDRPYFQLKTIDLDSKEEKDIIFEEPYNPAKPKLITGICRGTNCRVLYTTDDHAISLLQLPSGKVQWSREEALSNVLNVEFVDLPLSELDASIEREFNEASSNDLVNMFLKRVASQVKQLTSLLSGKQTSNANNLVRDDFGLHKLMIIATKVGKLFAIDTMSGSIIWSHYLRNIAPFLVTGKEKFMLLQQRTARYAPLSAEMTLIARSPVGSNGVMYRFDPITGKGITGITFLNFKIKQAMLLPYEDKDHKRPLLLLSEKDEVRLYPDSATLHLKEYLSTTYLFNADVENSLVNGYTLFYGNEQELIATPTWSLNLTNSKIVSLSLRPNNERVHSQGRVLADRSVLYKYVNPNLIALATVADDVMHRHVLSVYLIDGITGLVVYSAHHKRANGPVHLVHSENWVVYSYFSERFRRYEITSIELYEGARQSNSTAFSSHALSNIPHPETLSYILPVNPLAMVATLTERGITNKHLLIGITNGGVIEMPWAFLEPRGPHLPSNPEEGYIPYMPELPIHSEAIVNYNQTLPRIKGIQVSPARLESTSLVIVYGLDLFYTRVMPSKTFDVLKEDFDHWLIVMVLVGLTTASYITKRLSIRKALKQMWK